MFDGSDFPRQGRKSAGVARQYCGRLGKVANCPARMLLDNVRPLGQALVDKRLYLPKSWTSDQDRCAAAGVPEDTRGYRPKAELVLELLARALELGHLKAGGLPETTPSGCRRPSVRDWGPWGCGMCWTFRAALRSGLWSLPGPVRNTRGPGAPAKPKLRDGQRRTVEQRSG